MGCSSASHDLKQTTLTCEVGVDDYSAIKKIEQVSTAINQLSLIQFLSFLSWNRGLRRNIFNRNTNCFCAIPLMAQGFPIAGLDQCRFTIHHFYAEPRQNLIAGMSSMPIVGVFLHRNDPIIYSMYLNISEYQRIGVYRQAGEQRVQQSHNKISFTHGYYFFNSIA